MAAVCELSISTAVFVRVLMYFVAFLKFFSLKSSLHLHEDEDEE